MDYRKKKNLSVLFIDVDEKQEIKLANSFEEFLEGLVEEIAEETSSDTLSKQQFQDYYRKIDDVILNGKPSEIDRMLTKVLSNNELVRYLVEKMRRHEKPKVHLYLVLFLLTCAEGYNKGMIEDKYLLEVLTEFSTNKNKDVKAFAVMGLAELEKRLKIFE